jgi:hypothetical protein
MATATTSARPPFPPFTRDSAMQKARLAEDGWNSRDPGKVALAYAIDASWRNRSEFINGRTGSRYASLTSGTTTRVTGIAPMAMKTGSSMKTGSWPYGLRQSTTFPFWKLIANITGRSGGVPTTTQD